MTLRALIEVVERVKAMRGQVEIGVPASASNRGTSLATIAAAHEYGTRYLPQRSFLRPAIERNIESFKKLNFANLVKVAAGDMSFDNALGRLGEAGKAAVQTEITMGTFVPLKPATIRRKGSSKPLIDTGQLRSSITYVVTGGR